MSFFGFGSKGGGTVVEATGSCGPRHGLVRPGHLTGAVAAVLFAVAAYVGAVLLVGL